MSSPNQTFLEKMFPRNSKQKSLRHWAISPRHKRDQESRKTNGTLQNADQSLVNISSLSNILTNQLDPLGSLGIDVDQAPPGMLAAELIGGRDQPALGVLVEHHEIIGRRDASGFQRME